MRLETGGARVVARSERLRLSRPHDDAALSARVARAMSQLRGDLPLVALDVFVAIAAYLLLFAARFDFNVPPHYWDTLEVFIPTACAVHLGANALSGGYGRAWRHASIDEAVRLLVAGSMSALVLTAAFLWGSGRMPLSVLIAGPLLVTFFSGMLRFQSRLFAFRRSAFRGGGLRIAVVGAGNDAASALREMQQDLSLGLVPVAVIDDDPALRRRSIHGVPVSGTIDDIGHIVEDHSINQILLADSSASAEVVQKVADAAEAAGVPVRVLRTTGSWAHGMPRMRDLRKLDIGDLVGREQVQINMEPVRRLLNGKRVLVTGGGGWIGSEIARQVAKFGPAQLVLLDHDETHLHDALPTIDFHTEVALVDIRDELVLNATFDQFRPEVVFHAAAHKHVPILETYACEAIRTNVFGTLHVIDACKRIGTSHLVCISTDKAATPTSVMGASKWLAEQIVLARAPRDGYCSVRFGNVLGSRGSVIPTFQRQIANGGPVTVTDRRMTRFFMSTDEAVRLVLFGAAISGGRKVLALEMGEQVNIYELAERMIRLCGEQPHDDIEIRITGLRPGEKLEEAVIGPAEGHEPSDDSTPVVSILPVHVDRDVLENALEKLDALAAADDHVAARAALLDLTLPATAVELATPVAF